MSQCPKCYQDIIREQLVFSLFPLHFKCSNCKTRLTLINAKPFWGLFLLWLVAVVAMITYLPILRMYGLGVILSVFGWLVISYTLLPYFSRSDNISLYD